MKHLRRIFLKFRLLFANSKAEAELARKIGAHVVTVLIVCIRENL